MLFHSYFFILVFLPLSLSGWYLLNRMKRFKLAQDISSGCPCGFYAWYNVSFLWVMLGSCLFNFGVSFLLSRQDTPQMRKFLLIIGCAVNIGALGVFKYYNFFVENVNAVFGADFQTRNILLPLGISFFTFQQLSYLIDPLQRGGASLRSGGLSQLCDLLPVPGLRTHCPSCLDSSPVSG